MKKPAIPLAREGVPFIFFCGFTTLVLALLAYNMAAIIGLLCTGFVIFFFRDPSRIIPEEHNAVVAPADGKIILIEETVDPRFAQGKMLKLSIFMDIFNVHVNRIPYGGVVESISFQPGKFYSADKNKAALHNEYCALTIRTDTGLEYIVVQVAGLIARRIVCWAEKGDRVRPGQRYGLIRFGSRVDLYLPLETRIEVSKGQKVRAGETKLGIL
ncbi:phosphatidylserine decarboxylase family protein [Desulfolithobacter sp.]